MFARLRSHTALYHVLLLCLALSPSITVCVDSETNRASWLILQALDTEESIELISDGTSSRLESRDAYGSTYWYANIKRQGIVPYGNENSSTYAIWRNVRDYGAKGDGVTDDTDAINNATFDGYRCDYESRCESQTTTPATIYFPPGIYLVSTPLIMLYYTQFVGDATNLPVIKGTPDFFGIALLDSDPYLAYGVSWWQNQNNFWRQVRNFVLDMTDMPQTGAYHGLHWQVSQGTSIQNVIFNMATGNPNNTQQGIFMDNGSGGLFEDLVFNGGGIALFAGNQQWTARNLTFNNCLTAIYQNWNWVFLYKSITINNCGIGFDLTQGGGTLVTTGSMIIADSTLNNVDVGVLTTFSNVSTPITGGTLIVDNVDFVDTPVAIQSTNGTVIVEGNRKVDLFMQGRVYTAADTETEVAPNVSCYGPAASSGRYQQLFAAPEKPPAIVGPDGRIFERSKPQYIDEPVENFVSIRDFGCIGDGIRDETQCVQDFFDAIRTDQIAFIDHGAYVIRDTVDIPTTIRMVGDSLPLFMVDGTSPVFADMNNPNPAFRVGRPGDVGAVEMQEIIFETLGPAPGAVMMEWNLNGEQGANAMWDVHWRIGGSNGTQLQTGKCNKTPTVATSVDPECIASFLLLHITTTGSVLLSNTWGWIADHELDLADHGQINLYNGRGMLVESQGPVWIYGSSWEHNTLYNYNFVNARNIWAGHLQSEAAYMQANPNALVPFAPVVERWNDPTFENCFAATCFKTIAMRIYNSTDIMVHGLGFYSFFDNYDSACLLTASCQQNTIEVEKSEGVWLYALNTVGATTMVQVDGVALVPRAANRNSFCDTVAVFEYA